MSNTYKHKKLALYRRAVAEWRARPYDPADHCPDGWEELYGYHWTCKAPHHWINLSMERPFRRKNKQTLKKVLNGEYEIEFPKNHKKPFIYYW